MPPKLLNTQEILLCPYFIKQYSMTIAYIEYTVLAMPKVLKMLHCMGQGVFWLDTNTLSFSIK